MNTGPKGAPFAAAAIAFLIVTGLTGAALAQDFGASPAAKAARNEMPTSAFSPDAADPVAPAGKLRPSDATPALETINDPPEAFDRAAELIHQAAFSAGVVVKGSRSIRLVGIAATAIDAQCGSGPDAWPCGRVAR